MKLSKKNLKRFGAGLLCAALAASICLSLSGGGALALTSLPHIEDIVSTYQGSTAYKILEIVPQEGSGSIGYYIAGQEPSLSYALKDQTEATRATTAVKYLNGLTSRNILGNGTATPLTSGGGYTEKKPWQLTGTDGTSMTKLTLTTAETANVFGTFTAASNGAYQATPEISLDNGDYDQHILYFEYRASGTYAANGVYFYAPDFTSFAFSAATTFADGTPIYANTANDCLNAAGEPDTTEKDALPAGGTYYLVGYWNDGDLALDSQVTYYTAALTSNRTPYAEWSSEHSYAAIASGFDAVTGGHFRIVSYTYVGTGGNYAFTADPSVTAPTTVKYDTVWYSLGYTNNNWFIKYVLDQADASRPSGLTAAGEALSLQVAVLTAQTVTESDVSGADMIILSAGLDLSGSGNLSALYTSASDLSSAAAAAIRTENGNYTPILADRAVAARTGTVIGALCTELIGANTGSFAAANVLCLSFPFSTGSAAAGALATDQFNTVFSDAVVQSGFSAVLSEIQNENFLRKNENSATTDLFEEKVTIARAIRYILNYSGQRKTGSKASVTILELEPATAVSALTKKQVFEWLGSPTPLADYATAKRADGTTAITIVTMPMAEFVGRIEDLAETYDLIYVGDSAAGLNAGSDGETVYNDSAMNGLLYSNIGDSYVTDTNYQLSGLLDRDFTSGTFTHGTATYRKLLGSALSRTFRLSGNDLTATKAQELLDFAKAGYPIVLGDKLIYDSAAGSTNLIANGSYWYYPYGASVTPDTYGTGTSSYTIKYSNYNGYQAAYLYVYNLAAGTYTLSGSFTTTGLASGTTANFFAGSGTTVASAFPGASASIARGQTNTAKSVTFTLDTAQSVYIVISSTNNRNKSLTVSNLKLVKKPGSSFRFTASVSAAKTSGIAGSESVVLTAACNAVSGTLPSGAVYQWYKDGTAISGATGSSYAVTAGSAALGDYSCTVTLGGAAAASGTLTLAQASGKFTVTQNGGGTAGTYYRDGYTGSFTASLSIDDGQYDSGTTIYLTPYDTTPFYSVYHLYKDGTEIGSYTYYPGITIPLTLSAGAVGVYNTYVTYENAYSGNYIATAATSNTVTVSGGSAATYTFSGGGAGSAVTGLTSESGTGDSALVIDTMRVDYASRIYTALDGAVDYDNVMAMAEVTPGGTNYAAASALLCKYLNLSKPAITWVPTTDSNCLSGYPTAYSMTTTGTGTAAVTTITGLTAGADGKYSVTYSFKITNATDATPKTTTYDCRLFLDLNSDGLYRSSEQITDIVVRQNGALVSQVRMTENGSTVYRYQLKADTVYTVTREMPDSYTGILPWKLEVVKNGASYVHGSEHGYSHITREKTTIRVLQIQSNNGGGMNLATNSIYATYLPTIPDFTVKIDTIWANRLDNPVYWTADGKSYSSRADFLDQYDMLILGFQDAYKEISTDAAGDILTYSKNNAVLFTHDTTSIVNLPFNSYTRSDDGTVEQGSYYWGYAFNTILRSAVGLDRYGVTDATYGRTKMYSGVSGGPVSTAKVSLSAKASDNTTLLYKALQNAGYTVAFAPKATKVSELSSYVKDTVPETQGFTTNVLYRYAGGNTYAPKSGTIDETRQVYSVTQVNEGQITTYPFNLNTTEFKGTLTSNLSVAKTHEQYYQLNLNSDNIVVWYCLADNSSSKTYYASAADDVMNSYYIFSMGNITYSGAGHSGGTVTDDEAKLFINTMVAAFRSASEEPTVSFKSGADGATDAGYFFVTADYTDAAGNGVEGSFVDASDYKVYFKVSDPTLQSGRTLRLYYYYACVDSNGSVVSTTSPAQLTTFYTADTNKAAAAVTGGLVYYLKPSDISGLLDGLSLNSTVRLYLAVTTGTTAPDTAANAGGKSSYALLELRKIGLFPLG